MGYRFVIVAWCALLAAAGCTSVSNLDASLKQPVADAKSAADTVAASDQDVLKLYALGAARIEGTVTLATLVCWPSAGSDVAGSNLATFVDSLSAIDKVAAKPADSSYAAILGRIKEDEKATTKDYEQERLAALEKRDAGRARCHDLFAADTATATTVAPSGLAGPNATLAAASATFAALDKLANSILSAYEQTKRDAAIKATVREVVPQMKQALASLESPVTSGFGVHLGGYVDGSAAAKMNQTAFGAAVSVHRWWVAKTIQAHWDDLAQCRSAVHEAPCIGGVKSLDAANDLSVAVLQYRSLALIDTDVVIAGLHKGLDRAEKAADAKTLTALLDSLSQIGGALSTISSNYTAYQKTRE